jgi:hypothetical protein
MTDLKRSVHKNVNAFNRRLRGETKKNLEEPHPETRKDQPLQNAVVECRRWTGQFQALVVLLIAYQLRNVFRSAVEISMSRV